MKKVSNSKDALKELKKMKEGETLIFDERMNDKFNLKTTTEKEKEQIKEVMERAREKEDITDCKGCKVGIRKGCNSDDGVYCDGCVDVKEEPLICLCECEKLHLHYFYNGVKICRNCCGQVKGGL